MENKKWSTELINKYIDNSLYKRDRKLSILLGEECEFPESDPYLNGDPYTRSGLIDFSYTDDELNRIKERNLQSHQP